MSVEAAGVQVSICPGGVPTGYTYFIPQEEHLESRIITRSYMEAKMVVALSGRFVPVAFSEHASPLPSPRLRTTSGRASRGHIVLLARLQRQTLRLCSQTIACTHSGPAGLAAVLSLQLEPVLLKLSSQVVWQAPLRLQKTFDKVLSTPMRQGMHLQVCGAAGAAGGQHQHSKRGGHRALFCPDDHLSLKPSTRVQVHRAAGAGVGQHQHNQRRGHRGLLCPYSDTRLN